MRKTFVALFLLLGATALSANFAFALEDADGRLVPKLISRELQSRAAGLATSATIQDTTWVGYTPGQVSAANYWGVYGGNDGTYYRPKWDGSGLPVADKGNWNWDEPIHGDSLQGWWPVRILSTEAIAGASDEERPWTSLDWGNNANYVIRLARGANWQNETNVGQTEPGWRTFGVDGVWHRDGGSTQAASDPPGPETAPPSPNWTPIGGTKSAWMGMRAHGDQSAVDPLTGNAFNEDLITFCNGNALLPNHTDRAFPGYAGSMDQMLYRDIDFQGKTTSNLTVKFKYRANLSTGATTSAVARIGWFNHDPLEQTMPPGIAANNYISGMVAGVANAPRDSFMVYIGSGVDGNQWLGSDGNLYDLYDPRHRWFSEVLHSDWDPATDEADPRPEFYLELLSVSGVNATSTTSLEQTYTIDNSVLDRFLEKNNKIRLVFRVKTNRRFGDDERNDPFTSDRWGAVQVDDVRYQIGGNAEVAFGDFESVSSINNDPTVSALDAWKSTGKAPQTYTHPHIYLPGHPESVLYEDLCGDKGDARICNMEFGILLVGDHEAPGEPAGGLIPSQSEADWRDAVVSPTVQLVDDDGVAATKNVHGLYGIGGGTPAGSGDIQPTDDYYIQWDQYAGIFDGLNGSYFRFAMQAYPVNTIVNGAAPSYRTWGHIQRTGFIFFESLGKICEPIFVGSRQWGLLRTGNANGIPDSLRIEMEYLQLCYAFGVDFVDCAPTFGSYYDNAALAIVDGTPSLMQVDIWQWINDAFPANETAEIPGDKAQFDTTGAWVQTGLAISQDTNDNQRYTIAGDSVAVQTASGTSRVDMVFRVLPGPGNYGGPGAGEIGDGHLGMIKRVPTAIAPAGLVTVGDGSWWDVLRTNPGEYSTLPAGMTGLKAGWNPNFWISARCDTADANIYALQGSGVRGGPANANLWMNTWHESDKRYALLGILKNRCFVRCTTCNLSDIICNGTAPDDYANTDPSILTTRECTKIIPDGLLTPGSHVQYFFRGENGTTVTLVPDTTTVTPQNLESSVDGHRWQQFSILPDRWKDQQYRHPVFQDFGDGPACLLVVDWNDRRGNERAWVSVADTIGATVAQKYGAHNGWHAPGNVNQGPGIGVNAPSARVAVHGGSPGTSWDFYQVKASESIDTSPATIGSRLSWEHGLNTLAGAKSARNAPTPEMLDAYYTLMLILTGDLAAQIIRPIVNTSDQDADIIVGWLENGEPNPNEPQNRGLWIMGDGFVESLVSDGGADQTNLLLNVLRANLEFNDYQHSPGGTSDGTIDLRLFPEWQDKTEANIFGLRNACLWTTDVLTTSLSALTSFSGQYEKKGGPIIPGYHSGVFKDIDRTSATPTPYKTLVEGFDIENLVTRNDVNTVGRSAYFFKIFTNVWSKICANVLGTPAVPLDVPNLDEGGYVNFVNIAGNPMYAHAKATINFGLARADRVEVKVYDVSGRLVRALVDRQFPAGAHDVTWDGLDNSGRQVARGVYFTQVKFATQKYVQAKKLTVLR